MGGLQGGVVPGSGEKVKGGHGGQWVPREVHGDTKVTGVRVQFG